jgi:HK97 family phage major capsid protein
MALTLAQASLLTNSMLIRGVIETVVSESAVLNYLPFMEVVGSSLAFPQETALPTVAFNSVGGTWAESSPTFNQTTETLKILGGDADVDNYLERSFTQENDIQAVVLHEKAKAVAYQFNASFFSGDTGVDANSFDGIDKRIGAAAAAQTITAGANGAALNLSLMDQLIDAVKPGRPDVLFMSRRSRRNLNQLRRSAGNILQSALDEFGRMVLWYDGIPDTKAVGTSGNICSTVYALKFGWNTGVMGIHSGGIQVDRIGSLETKDASRNRVKWYCSIALMNPIGTARLVGVNGS